MFTTCRQIYVEQEKNSSKRSRTRKKTAVQESTKEIKYLWAQWRKIYTIPSLQLRIDLKAVQGKENLGIAYPVYEGMLQCPTILLRRNDEVTTFLAICQLVKSQYNHLEVYINFQGNQQTVFNSEYPHQFVEKKYNITKGKNDRDSC